MRTSVPMENKKNMTNAEILFISWRWGLLKVAKWLALALYLELRTSSFPIVYVCDMKHVDCFPQKIKSSQHFYLSLMHKLFLTLHLYTDYSNPFSLNHMGSG